MNREGKNKIESIEKIDGYNYLNAFVINYRDKAGNPKKWEMVSRGDENRLKDEHENQRVYTDAVSIFAHSKDRKKVILIKEFRIIAGKYVYTLPAGVVDPNEDPNNTAIREFKEETGLDIDIYKVTKPRFTSVGLSNERVSTAYGIFSGEISDEFLEAEEDITAFEVDVELAKDLMKNAEMTERTYVMLKEFFKLPDSL